MARAATRAIVSSTLLVGCPSADVSKGGVYAETDSETGGEFVDDPRTYFIGETTKFEGGGCARARLWRL